MQKDECHFFIIHNNFNLEFFKNTIKNEKEINYLSSLNEIYKKFNSILESCDKFELLVNKIISSTNNDFLFYTGLEEKLQNQENDKIGQYKLIIENLIENQNYLIKYYLVKTKLLRDKNKSCKRMLSILAICKLTNSINKNNLKNLIIVLPIEYNDFH